MASPTWITATSAAFGTVLAPLPRAYTAAAFMGGALYVTGGQTPNGPSTTYTDNAVFRSTDQGATWSSVTTTSAPNVAQHCLVADGTTLLSMGGFNGNFAPNGNATSVYASTNNGASWVVRSSSSPVTARGVACTVFGSKIYTLGGYYNAGTPSESTIVAQSADGGYTWVTEPATPGFTSRASHGVAVNAAGNMVVVGGYRAGATLTDVLLGTP